MPAASAMSRRQVLAWALAAPVACAHATPDVADVLQRPAATGARADAGVMLAISRVGSRLVVVGERGIVLLSDNHGVTWRQARVPVSVSLTAVQFVDDRRGWAVGHGGAVLSSVDGGASWTLRLDGIRAARMVQQAARAQVDASGEGGGPSARRQLADADRLVADGPDKPFLDVLFADARHGVIVGAYGLAFATDDGGVHWQSWMGRLPNPRGNHLYRIAAAGPRLFVVGEQGLLLRSDDGGAAFATVETPYAGTWFGAHADPDGGLLVYGLRGNAWAAAAAAAPWIKLTLGTLNSLADATVLSDGRLVLVDQAGQAFVSAAPAPAYGFRPLAASFGVPVSALVQAADGALVAATAHGVRRLAAPPPVAG